jgi:hypothetical protein
MPNDPHDAHNYQEISDDKRAHHDNERDAPATRRVIHRSGGGRSSRPCGAMGLDQLHFGEVSRGDCAALLRRQSSPERVDVTSNGTSPGVR